MGEYPKKDNHPIVIIAYNYEKQGEIVLIKVTSYKSNNTETLYAKICNVYFI